MTDFDRRPVAWTASRGLVSYTAAVAAMEQRVAAIRAHGAAEAVWLLEHPPLYTAGTGAREADLKDPGRFPIFSTGRGGQLTYHGPGQRVAYVMLDVQRRFGSDVRCFVSALEQWIISTLASLGITGEIHPGRVGVWVNDGARSESERKIAAVGIRIRRGVSYHGISLNVDPDLSHYEGIVPCGISDRGVTSLATLGCAASMKDVDMFLRATFEVTFGARTATADPIAGLGSP